MKRKVWPWRQCLALALGLTVLAIGLYSVRFRILRGVMNYLIVDDGLQPADIIFVLAGDISVRPVHAATLFHKGLAPRIVIARAEDSRPVQMGLTSNISDQTVNMLERLGVPRASVVELCMPGGVTSTFDEAELLRSWLHKQPAHTIILVTTQIHTRRARWIFRKVLADTPVTLIMSSAPDPRFRPDNWWRTEAGFLGCQNEYLKLLYYRLRH